MEEIQRGCMWDAKPSLDLDWKFEKCFSVPGQGNLKLFTPKIMEMSFVTPQMCHPDMTGNNSIGI